MHRDIRRLAVPALLTLAADPLVSLVDTAFVGRLGTVSVAALGVNAAIFSLAFFAFNFLAYGTTPLVANAVGQGDSARVDRAITQAVAFAVALGVLVFVGLELGASFWVGLVQTPADVESSAIEYLRIRAIAAPAVLLITAANGAFRGKQDTVTPLRVTLILNLINVVGDAVLIFGLGWGLAGAATATAVAQWVGAGWFVWLLRRHWLGLGGVRRRELFEFIGIGWAILVRTGALLVALTFATASVARIGTAALAAHQIVMQIWLLLALLVDALAVAGQALVGRMTGSGDSDGVTAVVRTLSIWGLAAGVILAAAVMGAGPLLEPIFGVDREVAGLARHVLPLVAALQPLGALLFVGDGVYLGAGRFRFMAATTVVAGLCSVVVLQALDGWRDDLLGPWIGISVLLVVRLIPQVVAFQRAGSVVSRESSAKQAAR